MARIAIYGAGGFGKEVRGLLDDLKRTGADSTFAGYIDDFQKPEQPAVPGSYDDLVIAIADGSVRRKIADRFIKQFAFNPVIHPDVTIRRGVQVGKGTIICSGARLTVDISVGTFVIINLNATVGHDVMIGDFASIMPGANISGSVGIGSGVFIGSGATILQGLKIGEDAVIGAGAVVTRDVPPHTVVAGVPARPLNRK